VIICAKPSYNNVTPKDTMIAGKRNNTYSNPDRNPKNAPAIILMSSITTVGRPASLQIFADIKLDNSAIAPKEKSNLPEFKLICSANVTSATVAVALKNIMKLDSPAPNSDVPLAAQMIEQIMNDNNGTAIVPTVLFMIFVTFI
jgi:hypothetical protein